MKNNPIIRFRSYLFFSFILLLLLSFGCDSNKNYNSETEENDSDEYGYEDGTYCADVTYYNPNTGTKSTYTLEVDVENNELVKIYWSNGGWLDEEDFSVQELDEDGYCSFTNDRGYEYDVQITGEDCGYTDRSKFESDLEDDIKSIECPKCGSKKSKYDEYCNSCVREIEEEEEY
jgi:hypothetical protein